MAREALLLQLPQQGFVLFFFCQLFLFQDGIFLGWFFFYD